MYERSCALFLWIVVFTTLICVVAKAEKSGYDVYMIVFCNMLISFLVLSCCCFVQNPAMHRVLEPQGMSRGRVAPEAVVIASDSHVDTVARPERVDIGAEDDEALARTLAVAYKVEDRVEAISERVAVIADEINSQEV